MQNIKLYKIPASKTKLRLLREEDCECCCALLNGYLARFNLSQYFSLADFKHWFYNNAGSFCYVIEENNAITDMISYYVIPMITGVCDIKVAYLYYYVSTKTALTTLVNDILAIMQKKDIDVLNCLDIHDNHTFIESAKFKIGSGSLNYYLYNWDCPTMKSRELALVLL
jgi:glycylpeptide N-tetradecanoyltransferase